jgi:hypothetical protein
MTEPGVRQRQDLTARSVGKVIPIGEDESYEEIALKSTLAIQHISLGREMLDTHIDVHAHAC